MPTTTYSGSKIPPKMVWIAVVARLAIAPVFLGALFLWIEPERTGMDVAAGAGLFLLGAIHVLYWSRPWPCPWPVQERRAVAAAAAMALTNLVLLHALNLSEPLLWLYPALVVGSGLRPPAAALGVGIMAAASVVPVQIAGAHEALTLGPGHYTLLAIVLAGLGMAAVRQLIAVNADLHATKAELAELAVAEERERLARELHDLLGRTLSLIAVKAELAGRLNNNGDPSVETELRDVQQLAREAIREVRSAVAGDRVPSVAAELAAAPYALRTAGIAVSVDEAPAEIDPSHEATVAWALRESVTNVVRHSGARICRIVLQSTNGVTTLEVIDDGRGCGPAGEAAEGAGTGLDGLSQRVRALGGTFEAGPSEGGGFSLRVTLGAASPPQTHRVPPRTEVGVAR